MKNVIVFGNQKVAIDCVTILKKRKDINLLAVVGCENLQDRKYGYESLKKYCQKEKIQYFEPAKLDDTFFKIIKELEPDICFSIFYRNIFKKQFIDLPKMGLINLHPSLLPKYRGPVPTLWSMLNGEKKTGITLHYINEGIDTGDIIDQREFSISENVTGFELNNELMDVGFLLFESAMPSILNGSNKRKKQNNKLATYYGKYKEPLRNINWYLPTERITSNIRAFAKPYAGAIANISGKNMILWKSRKTALNNYSLVGPGKILKVLEDGTFIVSAVDGLIHIIEYEFEGNEKNPQEIIKVGAEFLTI